MNPVRVLLLENSKTQDFIKFDGLPEVTWEDSALSSAGSGEKYYLAARLLHGDISEATLSKLETYLWWAAVKLIKHEKWSVPEGGEVYRLLCGLSLIEFAFPSVKSDEVRLIILDQLATLRRPKKPFEMTPKRWKRWKGRYAEIFKELQWWSDSHFHHMRNKLN